MSHEPCPCGSDADYTACCGPFINNERQAPTAEALMRSRYTAHVKLAALYLNATQRGPDLGFFDSAEMTREARTMTWLGLKVVSTSGGGKGDSHGTVEFKATYQKAGQIGTHHERSSFARDSGSWFYTSGKNPQPPARRDPGKVGRNKPCPCGSGKKYKKCCGKKG